MLVALPEVDVGELAALRQSLARIESGLGGLRRQMQRLLGDDPERPVTRGRRKIPTLGAARPA